MRQLTRALIATLFLASTATQASDCNGGGITVNCAQVCIACLTGVGANGGQETWCGNVTQQEAAALCAAAIVLEMVN